MHQIVLLISLFQLTSSIISPPATLDGFEEWQKLRQKSINLMDKSLGWSGYNCDRNPESFEIQKNPETVHQLTPSDIDVIAVLGDSLSVAEASKSESLSDMLEIFRGLNFVNGIDVRIQEQATLFNIFQHFNPRLRGGSSDHIEKFYDFNFAKPGANFHDLHSQADALISEMSTKLGAELSTSWKFLNIFIGHNNLCKYCQDLGYNSAESFAEKLRETLIKIRLNIPKVFVNIMPPMNVNLHDKTQKANRFCEEVHRIACPCLFNITSDDFNKIKSSYDSEIQKVVKEFQEHDDFTAVFNPAMNLENFPTYQNNTNFGLIAIDCFHLSDIAHDLAAKQIWKSLFENVGDKKIIDLRAEKLKFVCPPKQCPFLRTWKNSVNSTSLVIVFIRSTCRRPTSSTSLSDERRHLLESFPPQQTSLPIRADLNDSIF